MGIVRRYERGISNYRSAILRSISARSSVDSPDLLSCKAIDGEDRPEDDVVHQQIATSDDRRGDHAALISRRLVTPELVAVGSPEGSDHSGLKISVPGEPVGGRDVECVARKSESLDHPHVLPTLADIGHPTGMSVTQ